METTVNNEPKKGFNWMGFLASSAYYGGKGKMKKGILLAFINFHPFMMFFTGLYCGFKANKELDVQAKFSWKNAIIVSVVQVFVASAFRNFVIGFNG